MGIRTAGYMNNSIPRMGMGRGRGFGRGGGRGWRFREPYPYYGPEPDYDPYYGPEPYVYPETDPDQEKKYLERVVESLESELKAVKNRLAELVKGKEKKK